MQKIIAFVVLALVLTSASAAFSTSNFVKSPIKVVEDTEVNFTNLNGANPLILASITPGALYVVTQNYTANPATPADGTWSMFTKIIAEKNLASSNGTNVIFKAPPTVSLWNAYAISIIKAKDTNNVDQLYALQQPLLGGAAQPKLVITTNTNAAKTVNWVAQQLFGSTFAFFYTNDANPATLIFSSFTIGGAKGAEFNITTKYTSGLAGAIGEAVGAYKIVASWLEGTVLKQGVVEANKGLVGDAITVDKYTYSVTTYCTGYSTDKKLYGTFCAETTGNGKVNYYATTTNASLVLFANGNSDAGLFNAIYPYGPYLTIITNNNAGYIFSYEIWDFATSNATAIKNRTQFLTIDGTTRKDIYQVKSGGLYVLIANSKDKDSGPLSNISVGLLLSGSYLTSVLGLVLTIMASLMLF